MSGPDGEIIIPDYLEPPNPPPTLADASAPSTFGSGAVGVKTQAKIAGYPVWPAANLLPGSL